MGADQHQAVLPEGRQQLKVEAALIDAATRSAFSACGCCPCCWSPSCSLQGAAAHAGALAASGCGAVDVLAGTLSVYSFPGQLGVTDLGEGLLRRWSSSTSAPVERPLVSRAAARLLLQKNSVLVRDERATAGLADRFQNGPVTGSPQLPQWRWC